MLKLIETLNKLPGEVTSLVMLIFSIIALFVALRKFGATGIILFISLAIIIGNIQVLKATHFILFNQPVALGTVIFSMTYLATDILTEYYGTSAAKKAVWLGFYSTIFMTGSMLLTMGWPPINIELFGPEYQSFFQSHQAMLVLFLPAPAILLSSLVSYLISQYSDIWIFQTLKNLLPKSFVSFRSLISTAISSFIDNTIFSVLAWIIFSPTPLSWMVVLKTYILSTYALRLFFAALHAPFVSLARHFLPKDKNVTI